MAIVYVAKGKGEGDVRQRLLFQIKKLFLQEVIIKGKDLSYIVTLLTVLQFFTAVIATAGATLYSNHTYGVVYKFTVYLPKIRYKRRPLIPTVSYKCEIKVAATPPPFPLTT